MPKIDSMMTKMTSLVSLHHGKSLPTPLNPLNLDQTPNRLKLNEIIWGSCFDESVQNTKYKREYKVRLQAFNPVYE